jgi:transposase
MVGEGTGVLVADRYEAYLFWPADAYPFCLAHLVRDFVARAERGGDSQRIGEALLDEARTMFALWHRVCEGRLTRFFFRIHMGPVRRRVEALLVEGAALTHPKSAGLCRSLLERAPALWTFVAIESVEPTNNSGERSVRHTVLWRKGSFGTQSEKGSRFVERILTTWMTCRQQDRNVLDFLVAARNGTPAPSLVPRTRSP